MKKIPQRIFPISTPDGIFALEVTEKGLGRLFFPKKTGSSRGRIRYRQGEPWVVRKTKERLVQYLKGKRVSFRDLRLDWGDFSPFERKVLKRLSVVSYGSKVSYSDLARAAGKPKAARAVGSVMRKNRLPIVLPCHRVVASGGRLGGYSQGLAWKKRLLKLEKGRRLPSTGGTRKGRYCKGKG